EAPGKDDALALRKPQLRQARVGIQSAGARLRRQQLNLNRTRFTAPFNAVVLTEAAELGQLVGPQNTIATLAGTDQFWVEVAVPVAELDRIDIPGTNTRNPDGAKAIVTQDLGSKRIVRPGRVVRLMGELDTQGSMAKVLVAIDDPLQLKLPLDERGLPMLIGSFVDVTLVGNRSEPLIAIPREALRDGDSIWVAKEGRLEIRPITIAYSKPDTIFVRDAVKPGEALITSRIPVPIPNMKVRIDDAAHSSKKTAAVAPTQEAAP
ncbi:MAG: HlyD family efflux transporter periplasmic adaptor subunit, partial [Myxococcota bacterium]